jgi:hypothetical protein
MSLRTARFVGLRLMPFAEVDVLAQTSERVDRAVSLTAMAIQDHRRPVTAASVAFTAASRSSAASAKPYRAAAAHGVSQSAFGWL